MPKSKINYAAGDKFYASELNQISKNANDAGGFNDAILAGENIAVTTPRPIFIQPPYKTDTAEFVTQATGDGSYILQAATYIGGQTFNTLGYNYLSGIALYFNKVGTPTGNIIIKIYATAAGVPTGSALKTITVPVANILTGNQNFIFDTPLQVSENIVYAAVASHDNPHYAAGDYHYFSLYKKGTSSSYAGGTMVSSSDNGSNWSASANDDLWFRAFGYNENLNKGKVFLTDMSVVNKALFDGFILATANIGDAAKIQLSGLVSGFSSLEKGEDYYFDSGVLKEVITQTSTDNAVNLGDNSARTRWGQTFVVSDAYGKLKSIVVKMQKYGSPVDNLVMKIYEKDKSTLLGTSDTINGATLSGSLVEKTFTFSTAIQLKYGEIYYFELSRSGSIDAGNYYSLSSINGSDVYTAGGLWSYNGSAWAAVNYDMYFRVNCQSSRMNNNLSTEPAYLNPEILLGRGASDTELLIKKGKSEFISTTSTTSHNETIAVPFRTRKIVVRTAVQEYVLTPGKLTYTGKNPANTSYTIDAAWTGQSLALTRGTADAAATIYFYT